MTIHRIEGFAGPAEGDLTSVTVDGTKVAVALVEGVLRAVDDTCTHMACSLSEGDIEGTSVVCPCHFGRFDLATGEVLGGPPERPIGVWRAALRDGVLELER
jgi:3-phenylpropionate/trans-cinnamate dioxygenase ferredoxin subunit